MRRVHVSWPEQPETAGALDQALLDVYHCSRATVERLQTLRSNLLTALLSGEHEIPESYDGVTEATT